MKTNRRYFLELVSRSALVIALMNPSAGAHAAEATITASAVIVPAQVSELAFMISGIVKDIPVQEGDQVAAGQTLITLDAPDLRYAVVEAESALRAAQAYADLQKYQKVKVRRNGKVFWDPLPAVYLQRAEARAQQAQAALALAQINYAEAILQSPFDGTVASVEIIPGEFAEADRAVVTIASLNRMQLETIDLSEHEIAGVKIGAPVKITMESLNGAFKGTVVNISPIANTFGGDVVFKVTIAFDEQPPGSWWGMSAEVSIGS